MLAASLALNISLSEHGPQVGSCTSQEQGLQLLAVVGMGVVRRVAVGGALGRRLRLPATGLVPWRQVRSLLWPVYVSISPSNR